MYVTVLVKYWQAFKRAIFKINITEIYTPYLKLLVSLQFLYF